MTEYQIFEQKIINGCLEDFPDFWATVCENEKSKKIFLQDLASQKASVFAGFTGKALALSSALKDISSVLRKINMTGTMNDLRLLNGFESFYCFANRFTKSLVEITEHMKTIDAWKFARPLKKELEKFQSGNGAKVSNEEVRVVKMFFPPEIADSILKDLGLQTQTVVPGQKEPEKQKKQPKIKFNFDMVKTNKDLKVLIEKLKKSKTKAYSLLLYGAPGCHAKGTQILMYDGAYKNVEDINIGDKVMGIDSTPRNVLKTITGKEQMYRINTACGDSFVVNENHILSFYALTKKYKSSPKHPRKAAERPWSGKIINLTVKEYLSLSESEYKNSLRLYYPNAIEFQEKTLPIEPYFLGILLGDGCTTDGRISFSVLDEELKQYIREFCQINNFFLDERISDKTHAVDFRFRINDKTGGDCRKFNQWKNNDIIKKLDEMGIYQKKSEEKFIPNIYLSSSKQQRIQLLSGLLDTDGSLRCCSKNLSSGKLNKYYCYEYLTKSKQLAADIIKLARSLGLKTTKKLKIANGNQYYRLMIFGKISELQLKIQRKIAPKNNINNKTYYQTKFTIEKDNVDNYYGFTIDGDNLYIMDNFVVTHNCGKSYLAEFLAQELGLNILKKKASDMLSRFVGDTEKQIAAAFQEAIDTNSLLILDEADSLLTDRSKAKQDFQVSSVNTMLTCMENHPLPFVCTTNLKDWLDKASMRRFIFKIKYEEMGHKEIQAGVNEYFSKRIKLTEKDTADLKHITAGDFPVIKKKLDILEDGKYTKENIIEQLKEEQAEKGIFEPKVIGF